MRDLHDTQYIDTAKVGAGFTKQMQYNHFLFHQKIFLWEIPLD